MSSLFVLLALIAEPTTEASVIAEATEHSPTLMAAILDLKRAEQDVIAEEARYRPSLIIDAGITHLANPSLRRDQGVTLPTNDALSLSTELSQTFAWGTNVALTLSANRGLATSQSIVGSTDLLELGPSYGIAARLSLTQPLLRGFGTDIGEAALRQARSNRTAIEHARARAASELLRDVLIGYWELWYAKRALDIDRAAYDLAIKQRDDARLRLESGAIAPVDVLTFDTRVAELEEAVVASETALRQRSVQLATLLGREQVDGGPLVPSDTEVPPLPARAAADVIPQAVEESYDLRQQRAQLEIARDQAAIAGESDRPRLDLDAYVQAQGLGNQDVPPAFEQLVQFDAVSAHLGLVFELPLSSARREALRQSALLAASRMAAQLTASEQQVRATAATELVTLDQARRRIDLGTSTAEIAAKSASAQEERYQTGGAILLEVYQAQDAARRALLGVERARVDAIQAGLRIDHLTGLLLKTRSSP